MVSTRQRPWHSTALAAVLYIWALYMLGACLRATRYFPIGVLLLSFSLPLLAGLGAYLLFTGNKLRFLPFLVLPIMQLWVATVLFPDQLNPRDWQLDIDYFFHFPLGTRIAVAFFAACAVYSLILNGRGVYMASNNRWRGRESR
jgi:hypothetical protein